MTRKIIFLMVFLLFTSIAKSQDMKKVVEIIKQMETDLKAMIDTERKEREASFEMLKKELRTLRNESAQPSVPAVESKTQPAVIETKKAEPDFEKLTSRLQSGNDRFVKGKLTKKDYVKQRPELTKGQHPYAIVLSCSDSRVPPELLFDESLGRLFIIRTAGNVVDSVALGSIEYAAEHLHVNLLIVLGHEECGAVKATIAGGTVPPNIGSLVWRVKPAVDRVKEKHPAEKSLVSECVEENVRQQMEQSVALSGVLRELEEKGELKIMGALYSLETGAVRFMDMKTTQTNHSDSEKVKEKKDEH